jgi:hypothetical protein
MTQQAREHFVALEWQAIVTYLDNCGHSNSGREPVIMVLRKTLMCNTVHNVSATTLQYQSTDVACTYTFWSSVVVSPVMEWFPRCQCLKQY